MKYYHEVIHCCNHLGSSIQFIPRFHAALLITPKNLTLFVSQLQLLISPRNSNRVNERGIPSISNAGRDEMEWGKIGNPTVEEIQQFDPYFPITTISHQTKVLHHLTSILPNN